ncbi:MAG: HAD family hydrolase [Devosiaceae bacterium]|nr:HAD family hydrolase [Devosiaceae bacterium]
MNINGIIFDWDGTLGKTLHMWLKGYHRGAKNQGLSFDDAQIVADFFYEHDKGQTKYPHIDFTRLVNDAYGHLQEQLPNLELYETATQTLEKLNETGTKMALVTSSPRNLLFQGMGRHDVEKYFSSIITGDESKAHKPHPAPFLETLEKTGMSAEETLIIGDAKTDIFAGKAAGMKTCVFAPAENALFHSFEDLAKTGADFTIEKLFELVELV